MTLVELARIASRYDTDIAHAMLHAVAVAKTKPNCAFEIGDERGRVATERPSC